MKQSTQKSKDLSRSNLMKYLKPSTIQQKLKNNIHCRSMQQLQLNYLKSNSINKYNPSYIHHSSLLNEDQKSIKIDPQNGKSKSLNKFIALFQNSNILNKNENQDKNIPKKKRYNGFSYDLKIQSNSNILRNDKNINKHNKQNIQSRLDTINSKQTITNQKQPKTYRDQNPLTYSTLVVKKQQMSQKQNSLSKYHQLSRQQEPSRQQQLTKQQPLRQQDSLPHKTIYYENNNQDNLLIKMKQIIQEQKRREKQHLDKIQQQQQKLIQSDKFLNERQKIQQKCNSYQIQIKKYQQRISYLTNLSSQNDKRIKELQNKNKQYKQKLFNITKQKISKQCKQHTMIIKSLKKVINQQLNKIIQLQQFKIQNQSKNQNDHSFGTNFYSQDEQNNSIEQKNRNYQSKTIKNCYQQNLDYLKNDSIHSNKQLVKQNVPNYGKQSFLRQKKHKSPLNSSRTKLQKKQQLSNHFKSFFQMQDIHKISQQPYFYNKKDEQNHTSGMININEEESFLSNDLIEQITQENQDHFKSSTRNKQSTQRFDSLNDDGYKEDSILGQVDEYLSKWRNH